MKLKRSHVNRRTDRNIYRKTAQKTIAKNFPGKIMERGGTRL